MATKAFPLDAITSSLEQLRLQKMPAHFCSHFDFPRTKCRRWRNILAVQSEIAGSNIWYMYLVHVSGACIWYMYLVQVSGACIWCMYPVHVSGACIWCMYLVNVWLMCCVLIATFSYLYFCTSVVVSCL